MVNEGVQKSIIELIQKSSKILVMPSSPPDGDSIGSSLALYLSLKKLGKEVTVVCADPIPETYHFLPTANIIDNSLTTTNDFIVTVDCSKAKIDTIKSEVVDNKVNIIISPKKGNLGEKEVSFHYGPSKYDLIIVVDAGDLEQLGKLYDDNTAMFTKIPVINIDHHVSNSNFGKINYVDIMASSTTEMIIPLIEELAKLEKKELIDEDISTLLLAGIITDTGSFQNANTSPRAFASASHLLSYGARQQEIIQHVYKTKNLSTLKLWGQILTKIRYDKLFRIVWSTISEDDLKNTHSRPDETGDIIDELMTNAPGAEVVLLIKQRSDDLISCSVRTTNPSIDASKIAEMFDGGGHPQAAGFTIKNTDLLTAEQMIIQKVRQFQSEHLDISEEEKYEVIENKKKELPENENTSEKIDSSDEIVVEQEETVEKEVDTSEKPEKTVDKSTKKSEDEKTVKFEDSTEFEIDPGVTYKFEN